MSSSENESVEEEHEVAVAPVESRLNSETLSKMTIGELRELEDKVGRKQFAKLMRGDTESNAHQRVFKRANKNRPTELSSKVPQKVFREQANMVKKKFRDPRFDSLSGDFDEEIFNKTYSFLDDMRDNEREKILKKMRNCKSQEEKKGLRFILKRLQQKQKSKKEREQEKEVVRKHKREVLDAVTAGKTPHFTKKAELKAEILESKKAAGLVGKKRKSHSAKLREENKTKTTMPAARRHVDAS